MQEYREPTELDLTLQKIAADDWPVFVALVGEDAIVKAKICVLASRGKSIVQIANRLKTTSMIVRWTKKSKCNCK